MTDNYSRPLDPNSAPDGFIRLSLGVISAASLAYQVLLIRLFSIIQWHHFAYMIISLALLGYGGSGTFLTLTQKKLLPRFEQAYLANLLIFGFSSVFCFYLAQKISFNPEEFLWNGYQSLRLLAIYLILAMPFFFAANSIGLALIRFKRHPEKVYSADLLGAGLGSLGIVLLLFVVFPQSALKIVAGLGALAALVAYFGLKSRHPAWWVGISLSAIAATLVPNDWIKPSPLPYKGLSQALQIRDTRIVKEYSSPLGLLTLTENPTVPLRYAPGMSLKTRQGPPNQLGLFTDGDSLSTITQFGGNLDELEYLDQSTSALPYHVTNPNHALILGAGAGAAVLQARYHKVERIEAVELNPQVINLVAREYADFTGEIYRSPDTQIHVGEGRGFLSQSKTKFDLISMPLSGSFDASSSGLYALNENYLYTVEALQEFIGQLHPGGYLAISRWIKVPPRDTLKLFATAFEAMVQAGIEFPEKRLVLIRGWQTSTLLVKNGEITATEIESIKFFCQSRNFDVTYYSGVTEAETNRFNILAYPYFYRGARAIVSDAAHRDDFFTHYKFDLRPATDDKPYFSLFFKWQTFSEILELRGSGGLPLLESGYLVLVATLVQAAGVSVVLILLPLFFLQSRSTGSGKIGHRLGSGRSNESDTASPTPTVKSDETSVNSRQYDCGQGQTLILARRHYLQSFCYFSSLGLAFLFIEIALIQKFILFLHHPLYSMAVVLSAFLFFAGLGSHCTPYLASKNHVRSALLKSTSGILIISIGYLTILSELFAWSAGFADSAKIMITVILIAPLGFFMGIPFPLALTRLGQKAPQLMPWAWGINGCASVISAVLATLLAINFGFTRLIIIALCFYGIAFLSFPFGWKTNSAIANGTLEK